MTASEKLANDAWEAMLTAHGVLLREFESADIWAELSIREYDVLYTLAKHRRPLRMGELGRSVLLSQPGMSRLIDRLARRGLVKRDPDPVDGRSVRVSLTEAGADRQKAIGRAHAQCVNRVMAAALDSDELAQLRTIAGKLVRQATVPAPSDRLSGSPTTPPSPAAAAEAGVGRGEPAMIQAGTP